MGNALSPLIDCPLRIVVIAKPNDPWLEELVHLPPEARILVTGENLEALIANGGQVFQEANCLFCATGGAAELGAIIEQMPFLEWVHCLFAGIDHIVCPQLKENADLIVTNAKGVFSTSLAEYVFLAIAYFNKDLPRLMKNKDAQFYERFTVGEMRGKTVGIIGYGDIGQSVSVLAKAYGMRVLALRRRPELSAKDPNVESVLGMDVNSLNYVLGGSDYIVVCAALTPETYHMIGETQLASCKKGSVLINIGRGPLIDEDALIAALKRGNNIKGAALDVFTTEPLPKDSPLWALPNVLISPHNADMTADFRHKSVKLFTDFCRTFVVNGGCQELDNRVDVHHGY